jgi:hypothetical protein
MVRIHPDPPTNVSSGAIAQLGERLLCKQEVIGSIPIGSTSYRRLRGSSNQRRIIAALIGVSSEASIGCSLTIRD